MLLQNHQLIFFRCFKSKVTHSKTAPFPGQLGIVSDMRLHLDASSEQINRCLHAYETLKDLDVFLKNSSRRILKSVTSEATICSVAVVLKKWNYRYRSTNVFGIRVIALADLPYTSAYI